MSVAATLLAWVNPAVSGLRWLTDHLTRGRDDADRVSANVTESGEVIVYNDGTFPIRYVRLTYSRIAAIGGTPPGARQVMNAANLVKPGGSVRVNSPGEYVTLVSFQDRRGKNWQRVIPDNTRDKVNEKHTARLRDLPDAHRPAGRLPWSRKRTTDT
ncbi:hypothetical protein [Corynebacterium variabile]|uniref:hypothetical protein n=1 Tax=Corynebacterium variabile TaxID=1727 RepID=UPI003FD23718